MIDKKQLEELGWSAELISEVTRMSDRIKDSVTNEEQLKNAVFSLSSDSGDTINFTSSNVETNSYKN